MTMPLRRQRVDSLPEAHWLLSFRLSGHNNERSYSNTMHACLIPKALRRQILPPFRFSSTTRDVVLVPPKSNAYEAFPGKRKNIFKPPRTSCERVHSVLDIDPNSRLPFTCREGLASGTNRVTIPVHPGLRISAMIRRCAHWWLSLRQSDETNPTNNQINSRRGTSSNDEQKTKQPKSFACIPSSAPLPRFLRKFSQAEPRESSPHLCALPPYVETTMPH